jgi:hypothetical protein
VVAYSELNLCFTPFQILNYSIQYVYLLVHV